MAVCLCLMDVRALVVEDNQVNVRLLLAMLKGKNITDIEVAEDANQAFEALQTGSFDLIFMDIQLPPMITTRF